MWYIREKEALNETVFRMKIEAPAVARKVQPGQFVMLRIDEQGERIPLTVADSDSVDGTVTIIFQAVGATTRRLAALKAGEPLLDFVGPLGRPTEWGAPRRAVVIGGGVGCAIAYPLAKALHAQGVFTTVIAGFRNRDMVILEEELRAVSDRLYLTTDDGSYGEQGLVTGVLSRLLEQEACDLVVAVGPLPMMKFVSMATAPYGVKTLVSLNPIMIDGTGMCGGCRVHVDGKVRFACVDGPDFDGHQVDFDELMRRNRFYQEEEAHACRLMEQAEKQAAQ